ncbi:MAG: substrate-binding domain-containing protein [Spirochaetes bacterium]|jgi:DNA-binding LacI/PurR family transcriptional regulator|nr:substrate-binding domain-containing protein [Spirochaetota bacterium]
MAKTIGLIIDQLVYEYQAEMWHGVCDMAQKLGCNLISYVGSTIDFADNDLMSQNKIYEYISNKRLDGAIVLISSVSSHVNKAGKLDFMHKIAEKCPVISVGDLLEEYPSIGVDNHNGMFDSVNHLITKHGKRKIAFVGGPKNSDEAATRLGAYKAALKANNIAFDEKLYFEGSFIFSSGVEAINAFTGAKTEFDAVVAASDWMAFGVIQQLLQLGFKIPEQIAITGFDNVESAYVSTPPLSSVKQPVYEMGQKAVRTILDMIDKRPYEKKIIYPTEFIVRDSCGCLMTKTEAENEAVQTEKTVSNDTLKSHEKMKSSMIEKLKQDIEQGDGHDFLHYFNSIVDKVTRTEDISEYQKLIFEIRESLIRPELLINQKIAPIEQIHKHRIFKQDTVEKLIKAVSEYTYAVDDYLHRARLIISRKAEQLQFVKYLDANNKSAQIITIGQNILTTYNRNYLFSVIKRDFPKVDIPSCAIVQYSKQQAEDNSEYSKMLYYYNKDKDQNISTEPFKTEILIPDQFWPDKSHSPWIANVVPISYQGTPVGFVFYESKNRFGLIFEAFSSEISSALKGIQIYEDHEKVSNSIQDRSRRINELVAPMLESILQVSNISGDEIQAIRNLSDMTATGLSQLKSANDIIGKASSSINQMLGMIDLIEDVSANINILALNASIESARAGTYGLGFQVIAEEIKQLSDTTASNTKNISEVLKSVVSNIEESSSASQENFKVFTKVKDHVAQVTNLLTNVTNKMNELSSASNDILTEIERKI